MTTVWEAGGHCEDGAGVTSSGRRILRRRTSLGAPVTLVTGVVNVRRYDHLWRSRLLAVAYVMPHAIAAARMLSYR